LSSDFDEIKRTAATMDYTNQKYPFGIDFSNVSPIPD